MILQKKGGYLVAWKVACRNKEDGGLGILDLKLSLVAQISAQVLQQDGYSLGVLNLGVLVQEWHSAT